MKKLLFFFLLLTLLLGCGGTQTVLNEKDKENKQKSAWIAEMQKNEITVGNIYSGIIKLNSPFYEVEKDINYTYDLELTGVIKNQSEFNSFKKIMISVWFHPKTIQKRKI